MSGIRFEKMSVDASRASKSQALGATRSVGLGVGQVPLLDGIPYIVNVRTEQAVLNQLITFSHRATNRKSSLLSTNVA
jgi:hypothetical protein